MIDCDLVIDKAGQLHDPVMPVARTDGAAIGELESLASGPKQRLKAVPPGNVSADANGAGRWVDNGSDPAVIEIQCFAGQKHGIGQGADLERRGLSEFHTLT